MCQHLILNTKNRNHCSCLKIKGSNVRELNQLYLTHIKQILLLMYCHITRPIHSPLTSAHPHGGVYGPRDPDIGCEGQHVTAAILALQGDVALAAERDPFR